MRVFVAGLVFAAASLAAGLAHGDRLADIKARGFIQCGVSEHLPGFATIGANSEWAGIEVDYCRAVAAAIFNNAKAVRFTGTSASDRWQMLSTGQVDVLARASTWTIMGDTQRGLSFVGTLFYDGQGFMVKKSSGVVSALGLSDAAICIEQGPTSEANAADYFASNQLTFKPMVFADRAETVKAFEDGRCGAYTGDISALAASRSQLPAPDDYVMLPEIISKEPLSVVVAAGDERWFNIVRWTYFALLNAEEVGVSSNNIDEMLGSDNPEIKRLLGVEGDFGAPIGLGKDWAYQIIKDVGNYGEIYEANLGPNTPLKLPRGLNALWKDGGI